MPEVREWTVLESRYVRKDRWIALREDRCLTADGIEVSPYYVLDFPDWVQVVAFDEEDRLLMVRQYRHGSAEITLELPAGKIDPEDRDALQAAARELLEETGCVAETAELVCVDRPNPAVQSNRAHTVLCRGVRRVQPPEDSPTERIDPVWLPLGEVIDHALSGRFSTAIQVASLFLALKASGRLVVLPPPGSGKESAPG